MRYSLVAVDFLPPPVVGATLRKVAARLASGELRPLRHISHALGSAASAFRQMIQVGRAAACDDASARSLLVPAFRPWLYCIGHAAHLMSLFCPAVLL